MTRQTGPRHPGRWMLAVAILVLMLALAACGGRANRGSGGTTMGNTTISTSQQSTGLNLSSDDQQIQGIIQSMDSVSSDANTDFSSQDNNTVP